MSLGEIPGGNLRAYYHLENVNDSSGNGYTLTNNNSVAFNQGKFNNSADFGSSGTNKGLTYSTGNILSSTNPTDLAVNFWFKLNSTANTATKVFFAYNSNNATTSGINFNCSYVISAGSLSISSTLNATGGGGPATATISGLTPNTNWNHLIILKNTKSITIVLNRQNSNGATTAGTLISVTGSIPYLSIGNNLALTAQCFAMIDECIIDESIYSLPSDAKNRIKYYTQAKGRFAI